jgi:hypothetical protein
MRGKNCQNKNMNLINKILKIIETNIVAKGIDENKENVVVVRDIILKQIEGLKNEK